MISHCDAKRFVPRSLLCLRSYSARTFTKDLLAGVTVGIVALPLALAFAISSGVAPQAGLYTAIFAGFLISALGGSTTQIGGPTGAFVIVVVSIIEKHGLDGLYTCTFMAGGILIILGLTGLGAAVGYLPRPVVIGFTNGIAVLIASTQIKDFFGLAIEKVPGDFLGRIEALATNWSTLSPSATGLAGGSLLLLVFMAAKKARIPGSIVAVLCGSVVAAMFSLPVETIHTRFGGLPQGLPDVRLPAFRPELFLELLAPAITVAMLGAIESLLSAVVADNMTGDRHNSNVELFAQGVANVVSPLVGGLPATGAIARTATNIRSGAQTPVAGMIHAATLLVILLAAAPLASFIPLPVLAAVLLMVSYNMGEWHEIPEIVRLGPTSASVWFITFALTVVADLTVAVEAGIILAALLFIRKVTHTTTVAEITAEDVASGSDHSLQIHPIPEGACVFEVSGPLLFGGTEKLSVIEERIPELPSVIILRVREMTAIDATGVHALESLAERVNEAGKRLVLCGMRDQPSKIVSKAKLEQVIGDGNVVSSFKEAATRAATLIEHSPPASLV